MHFSQKIFLNQYIRNCFEFIVYLYYERYAFVHFVDVTVPVCCLRSVHRALLNCTLSDSDDLKGCRYYLLLPAQITSSGVRLIIFRL